MLSIKHSVITVLFLLLSNGFCWSQNIAPTLTATGNQPYCPNSQINIVTDFNITDPDDTEIEALFIQISTGYVLGEDRLTLTGSHPSILTSWDAIQGKLTLFGVGSSLVSYTKLIAATKAIVFQSTSNNPIDKTFSITIGDANYLPSTDHYYEYVSDVGIIWTAARAAAENRTYFGLKGYLATITSADEAQLTGEQVPGAGWIGGSDEETEGIWKWVTGPEAGTVFWNGAINGSSPNFAFWNTDEPNNCCGGENYAHVTAPGVGIPGSWNDLTLTGNASGNFQPKGYVVEYGGTPGDPILNIATSSSIFIPKIIDTQPAVRCGNGTVILEATSSSGDVLWFDSQTGGIPLFNGPKYTTPTLSNSKTYYVLASVNGCTEGQRSIVEATVTPIPTINTLNDTVICESGSGMLSATASAGTINWYELSSGGLPLSTGTTFTTPILNSTTTYYVDATFNGCTTAFRVPVTAEVEKTPLPSGNSNQFFCDINQATISDLIVTGNNVQWYSTSESGVPLNDTDLLKTNTTYYATQTVNGCESANRFSVNVFVFETVALPNNIPDLNECDSLVDSDNTNGFTVFDLTNNEVIILNGKQASDFTFLYFTDASYTNPIKTPSNAFVNTTIDGQTIYVRIVNNTNTVCFTDTSFNVVVNKLPVIQNTIVFKNCDEDGMTDGFTDFNLNEVNDVITNNKSSNLIFSYYVSLNDANTESNPISSIFNNQNTSIIYTRVENNEGCYRVSTVNLETSTTSFPLGYLETLVSCDDDDFNDGFYSFDLETVTPSFIGQFPSGQNLSVHYFENLNDAQLEQNEILQPNNYFNTQAFSQTIYVRIESNDNGDCFGIGPHLLLTVNPRPDFEVDNSEIYCLDNNPITLSTFNSGGDNYTYQWKDSSGELLSSLPFAEVVAGGDYTVTATSDFGCESFPVVFSVIESAIADIDIEDVNIVELSDNNTIIINNEVNNLGVGDYEFSLNDINGFYQDSPVFSNLPAGSHTIYVKDKNGCGIESLEVFILGFPKFFTPNNDGVNDTWKIRGLGSDFTNTSKINIYNRYGKLLKVINAKNGTWDGTLNGSLLPNSDYWFVAELVKDTGLIKTYRGHFSLIR